MTHPQQRFFARSKAKTRIPLKVESLAAGVATMRLYDVIDSWGWPFGVSANDFAQMLDELPSTTTEIQLHINSPGGETTEAQAILNMLRSYPADVVCIVDGIAASAASVIAAGSGRTVMLPGSQLMVHDAWGICIGNAADMAKTSELLNVCSDNIAAVYAAKAGGTAADWRTVMTDEAWYNAAEAVAAGLADEVGDPAQYPMAGEPPESPASQEEFEELAEMFDLSGFRFQGRRNAPTPKTPAASASGHTSKRGDADMAFLDDVRQKLGVADAEADEQTVMAALDEVLAGQAEETPQPVEPTIPDGMELVPTAALADLRAGAKAGMEAREHIRLEDRKQFLDSVQTKYAPASRAAWEKQYDTDPVATRAYFSDAPEIIPTAEIGHARDDEGASASRGWADSAFPWNQKGA